ncbi:serine hydrolase [Paraburkholderia sp. DHOC27]|uniref:serine hydrolase n=1 Tax=Paraburkholderia sp. DHOC27 TaxID=2303330 RepID=UPI000E3B9DB1|nr:serine hydrolase [Paraburkholderia sp. DHOC27]RFU47596.1 DUF3471 domain-containing protein [Paraburkholderia sp. DHOC27]
MCSTPRTEKYAKEAQEIVTPFVRGDLFSGVVLVAKQGEVIFREAFGFANREWAIPNTPDTRFRIGSITKQFTAAAILRLADRGKLSVADRLGQYLSYVPDSWQDVTLHQLLTHTSGIPSYTNLPDFSSRISLEERTPRAVMELTRDQPLECVPGEQFRYSNTGYTLLGSVLESITGQTYADFLHDEFFEPLGMRDSGYEHTTQIIERRADGYTCVDGRWRHARYIAMSLPYAAGGLYSTVDDLYRWSQALMKGDVIRPDTLEAMLRDHGQGYGYGWFIATADERRFIHHGGAINGFLGTLDLRPDDDLTTIVLANLQACEVPMIATRLARASLGLYQPPRELVLDTSKLDEYVGAFQIGPGHFLEMSRSGDQILCAHLTGRRPHTLACSAPDLFVSKTSDVEMTFNRTTEGTVSSVTVREHGATFNGQRTDKAVGQKLDETAVENDLDIAADPPALSQYVGRYRHPRMHFEVTLSGDQLLVQATKQPKLRAVFENDRTFVIEEAQAKITFEHTDRNGVWALMLLQAGARLRAFKLFDMSAA